MLFKSIVVILLIIIFLISFLTFIIKRKKDIQIKEYSIKEEVNIINNLNNGNDINLVDKKNFLISKVKDLQHEIESLDSMSSNDKELYKEILLFKLEDLKVEIIEYKKTEEEEIEKLINKVKKISK